MTQKQTGKFCKYCQKRTLGVGSKPNHTLHLLLTVFTAGIWGIFWILITMGKLGGYRCSQCGNKV